MNECPCGGDSGAALAASAAAGAPTAAAAAAPTVATATALHLARAVFGLSASEKSSGGAVLAGTTTTTATPGSIAAAAVASGGGPSGAPLRRALLLGTSAAADESGHLSPLPPPGSETFEMVYHRHRELTCDTTEICPPAALSRSTSEELPTISSSVTSATTSDETVIVDGSWKEPAASPVTVASHELLTAEGDSLAASAAARRASACHALAAAVGCPAEECCTAADTGVSSKASAAPLITPGFTTEATTALTATRAVVSEPSLDGRGQKQRLEDIYQSGPSSTSQSFLEATVAPGTHPVTFTACGSSTTRPTTVVKTPGLDAAAVPLAAAEASAVGCAVPETSMGLPRLLSASATATHFTTSASLVAPAASSLSLIDTVAAAVPGGSAAAAAAAAVESSGGFEDIVAAAVAERAMTHLRLKFTDADTSSSVVNSAAGEGKVVAVGIPAVEAGVSTDIATVPESAVILATATASVSAGRGLKRAPVWGSISEDVNPTDRSRNDGESGEGSALLAKLLQRKSCLIITDVQNDFCEGGSLGGSGRRAVITRINRLRSLAVPKGRKKQKKRQQPRQHQFPQYETVRQQQQQQHKADKKLSDGQTANADASVRSHQSAQENTNAASCRVEDTAKTTIKENGDAAGLSAEVREEIKAAPMVLKATDAASAPATAAPVALAASEITAIPTLAVPSPAAAAPADSSAAETPAVSSAAAAPAISSAAAPAMSSSAAAPAVSSAAAPAVSSAAAPAVSSSAAAIPSAPAAVAVPSVAAPAPTAPPPASPAPPTAASPPPAQAVPSGAAASESVAREVVVERSRWNAEETSEDIGELLFDVVVVSQDWHPSNHASFASNHTSNCDPSACRCGDSPTVCSGDAVENEGLSETKAGGSSEAPQQTAAPAEGRRGERETEDRSSLSPTEGGNRPAARTTAERGAVKEEEDRFFTKNPAADEAEAGSQQGDAANPRRKEGRPSEEQKQQRGRLVSEKQLMTDEERQEQQQEPLQEPHMLRVKAGKRVRRAFSNVFLDLWPVHCVQHSYGAALHPGLLTMPTDVYIKKGTVREVENYSCFGSELEDTGLTAVMQRERVEVIVIVGFTTEYCVRATALSALQVPGIEAVYVLTDCCCSIDPEQQDGVFKGMQERGVHICSLQQLLNSAT